MHVERLNNDIVLLCLSPKYPNFHILTHYLPIQIHQVNLYRIHLPIIERTEEASFSSFHLHVNIVITNQKIVP